MDTSLVLTESPCAQLPTVLMARQPILDERLKLFAYELLFRSSERDAAQFLNGDAATSQVVLNSVTGITDHPASAVPVFINMTESMLQAGRAPQVPAGSVVLEVLETVRPSAAIVDSLLALKQAGYRLALDDFIYSPPWDPLLALCDFVKVDIRMFDEAGLRAQVDLLQPFKRRLLAEKIETHAELELCKSLGFTLFQGYFLERPQIVHGKKISADLHLVMTLLSELQRENISMGEIAALVGRDARLSYQLLRIINSAAFGRPRTVSSVQAAVQLLGIKALRNWVSLIAMANSHSKPQELMTTLLVRARSCEGLARAQKRTDVESAFTVGLFSGLDAMLDTPFEQLLPQMPLSEELKLALTKHTGPLGEILQAVVNYEHGAWEALEYCRVDIENLARIWFEALIWVRTTQSALAE